MRGLQERREAAHLMRYMRVGWVKGAAVCVCIYICVFAFVLDHDYLMRYMRRVRWVKGGGSNESESKNWMAR